jgi:hypothetical protein
MALRWTNEARGRIAPRTLADLDLRRSNYASSWRWLRSYFTPLGWNELEAPPDEVQDDRLKQALDATSPDYTAELFGQKYGVARVFGILLPKKDKGLTPAIARTLILRAGDDLAACAELAAAAWETGDVVTHRTLAYAFFENDAWREQALAEILKLEGFSNEALALVRTEDEARSLLARKEEKVSIEYCELSAGLEEAALPLLMEMAPKVRGNMPHLSHALALSVFDDRGVAEHFAAHLSHPTTRGVIGSYFERHRALAEEVLPAASKGASRNAALVKALMIKVIGAPKEDIELAPEDDEAIPEVLRDPPWKKKVPPAPKMKLDLAQRRPHPRRWRRGAQVDRADATGTRDERRGGGCFFGDAREADALGAMGSRGQSRSARAHPRGIQPRRMGTLGTGGRRDAGEVRGSRAPWISPRRQRMGAALAFDPSRDRLAQARARARQSRDASGDAVLEESVDLARCPAARCDVRFARGNR